MKMCHNCLSDKGRSSARLVLPDRRKSLRALVVTSETVNTRLNKNKTELGVTILTVTL